MRLRQKLTQMTESPHQPQEHPAMLDQISKELPNTIRVRECGRDPRRFTCGMHAFGFEGNPEYEAVALRGVDRAGSEEGNDAAAMPSSLAFPDKLPLPLLSRHRLNADL